MGGKELLRATSRLITRPMIAATAYHGANEGGEANEEQVVMGECATTNG